MNEINTRKHLVAKDSKETKYEMSVEQFKESLPKQLHNRVSKEVMKNINTTLADQHTREHFRDNLLSYTNVLKAGKFKLNSYIDATRYVSFKLLGYNNQESYSKTFPGRITILLKEGATEKVISSYVAAYNKNKLVNAIWEQTLIPSYVLNADLYQKAINVQAELMTVSSSDKVRTDAANSLLSHLKPPEIAKVELDINVKDNKTIDELRKTTLELANIQKKLIQGGSMSAKDIAHSDIIIKAEDITEAEIIEDKIPSLETLKEVDELVKSGIFEAN